jgi:CRISPR type III-B/RAMP module-associated protein Cmr5
MTQHLDHLRAKFAAERIMGADNYQAFGNVVSETDQVTLGNGATTTLGDYLSVVQGAVPFLRQCGLLQLAAFYASKKNQHHAVLTDLAAWLRESPLTSGFCTALNDTPAAIVAQLTNLEPSLLPLLEAEAEAILVWLKRLAEAKAKELEAAEEPEEQAAAAGNAVAERQEA